MAISELKAVLNLQLGNFKADLSVAKSSMDGFAKDTAKAMDNAAQSTQKSQGLMGKAFNGLADQGDKFKNQQDSMGKKMAKTAFAFVGITSAASIFNKAIGRVDQIKSAEAAIAQLTGSNEKAAIVMDGLQEVVNGTPLSLDSFTASAKGMVAAGMEVEKVEGVMTAVGDAAYGVGEGAPSIDIMAGAFKSLQASGTASLGDLNRLADQNIPVYKILGNQMGKSTEDMKKFITDGLLPSGEAMDLLVEGIEEGTDGINGSTAGMAGQMQTAGDTIAGASSNIATAIVKVMAEPIDGAYTKIVTGLNAVKDGIKTFQPFLIEAFTAITEIVEGVILGVMDTIEMLKPAFAVIIEVVKEFASHFKVAGEDGEGFKEMARKMTPIVLGLIAAFKGFVVIAKTASTLRMMSQAISGSAIAMGKLGPVSRLASKGIKGLGTAMKFLGKNPIILVIAAIVAAVAAIVYLWKNNEDFRNAVIGIWKKIQEVFKASVEAVKGFMTAMGKKITEVWEGIKTAFNTAVEFVKNVITVGFMVIHSIISGIMLVIKSVIQVVWETVKAYFTFIFEVYKTIFTVAFNILKTIVTTVFEAVKNVVVTVWTAISDFFMSIFIVISDIFTTFWYGLVDILAPVLEFISGIITAVWTFISDTSKAIWETLVSWFTVIWDALKAVFTAALNKITAVVTTVWNGIKSVTTTVWNAITSVIKAVWSGIKTAVTIYINAVKSVITTVWNGIKAVTSTVWNGIKTVITTVINTIKTVITTVVNGIKTTVTAVWNGIKTTTSTVWKGIKDAMTKPVEVAKNKIQSIIDAIKGFFSRIRLKLPSIEMPKLPHFSLTGSFSLKPPSVPKLGVNWYATGGIATAASVVGIGEAGDEAIVPLSNKGRMKPFAQAVSSYISEDSKGKGSGRSYPEKITVEIPFYVGSRKLATVLVDDLMDLIDRRQDSEFRRAGDI